MLHSAALASPALPADSAGAMRSPESWFRLLCLAHALVWVAVPLLMYHNPPKDSLEGVAWGYLWQFGYDKHPFLAPWLSALFVNLCGSVEGGLYLASQVAVVLAFWGVWRLAREIVGPWEALLAVLLLEGVNYYNLSSIAFNPNVVSLPCWALATLAFYRAVKVPSARRWVLAGAASGLAVLAKYEVAVLFLPMLALVAGTPEGRAVLRRPAFYLGLASLVLVASPNLVWLVQHDFLPFHYTMEDMALARGSYSDHAGAASVGLGVPLLFLLEQVGCLLPLALLAWLALGRRGKVAGVAPALPRFERRFLIAMSLGPLATTLAIAAFSHSAMVARWAFPFFGCAGLAVVGLGRFRVGPRELGRVARGAVALNVVLVAGTAWAIFVQPMLDGRAPYSIVDPNDRIARAVDALWHTHYAQPLPVLAGDRWTIAGIDAFSPDRPIPYFDWSDRENPWLDAAGVRRLGGVFVQRIGARADIDALRTRLARRFPGLEGGEILSFRRDSHARLEPLRLWVAILPPGQGAPDSKESARPAKVSGVPHAVPGGRPLS